VLAMRTLFSHVNDAVIIAEAATGQIVLWNPGAVALFGYAEHAALAMSVDALVPERVASRHIAGRLAYAATGHGRMIDTGLPLELPARRSTGDEITVELSFSPFDFPAQEARPGSYAMAIVRDVTRRSGPLRPDHFLADASAILASSLDFETTLQSVARLAVISLADYCVLDMLQPDGTVRRLAAASADPAREELVQSLLRFPSRLHQEGSIPRALRLGTTQLVANVTYDDMRASAGSEEQLRVIEALGPRSRMAVPLKARGRTLGVLFVALTRAHRTYGLHDVAVLEDLAARCALAIDNALLFRSEQEAREWAEAAVRVRDEFLSIAAHELRTPVAGLRGFARMLTRQFEREGHLDPERGRTALHHIDRQSGRLAGLVNQLLDVSRLETGWLDLNRSDVDLVTLVREAVDGARAMTSQHTFLLDLPETMMASIDALRIEQVISNIVDNAVRYSPAGGVIEVTLQKSRDDAADILVRDHGIGISDTHRESIFQRFYRADPTGMISGMGLGMYISKEIVERHGGRIWAEAPEDGGTRFVVRLPLRDRG